MIISFEKLEIENFKNHKSLSLEFADLNKVTGRNGAGKSSIGDSITWLLFGTDIVGSKLDPKPIYDTSLETKVKLVLTVDSDVITLCRSQKKAASYEINGVPEKATAFNELVDSLFDKNLFLSLFNPTFFFTQKWQDQRLQILKYIDEPLNAEVFAEMAPIQHDALEGPMKKNTLEDLEKIHRERYKTQDKAYERASERVITLEEQLNGMDTADQVVDEESIKQQITILIAERDNLDAKRNEIEAANQQRVRIESKLETLKSQITNQRNLVSNIKNQTINEHCGTCGQTLDEESIQKVKESLNNQFANVVQTGKKLVVDYNELQEQLKKMPDMVPFESGETAKAIDEQIYSLNVKLLAAKRVSNLKNDISSAQNNRETIRQERAESLKIVEAIKAFRSKQAELMVKKVGDLFTTISVRLFEELKNGELRDTFEIEMDGKPYSKLSTAEKIKCGLEMIDVLSHQSGVIAPTFVDNAESILKYTAPAGQLITAKVKAGELKIETEKLDREVA